jgi:hypothetical protein
LDFDDDALQVLAIELHDRLAPLIRAANDSPWMLFEEAVAYSRIPAGTFRRLSAAGLIPSHGGRTRLYHRDEIDEAIFSGRAVLTGTAELSSRRAS